MSQITNNQLEEKSPSQIQGKQEQKQEHISLQRQNQFQDINQHREVIPQETLQNRSIKKQNKYKGIIIVALIVFGLVTIGLVFRRESSFIPTLGQPNEHTLFNNTVLSKKNWEEVEVYMNRLFKPFNDTNCQFIRFGDSNDGGYVTCLNQIEKAKALINFGVEGRDQYGCQVSTKHQMANLQYDCTNNIAPSCKTNSNGNKFHFICIGSKNQTKLGKQFTTIKNIIDENKLYREHIWMKIDIEGGQWQGFKALPISYLDYIDQIVMEVHIGSERFPSSALWGNLEIIENLMDHYINVNFHVNNWACFPQMLYPSDAFEVTLINKKLIKLNSQSRSFTQNKLNRPNNQYYGGICSTNNEWEKSIQHIDQKYPKQRSNSQLKLAAEKDK